jgi:hypothetical protein
MVSPEAKRTAVAQVRQTHGASERRACGLVGQPRSTERYTAKAPPADDLAKRLQNWRRNVRALATGV